jgi:hypothetical protein
MDPTALYYALSTIAQCAAALAALIAKRIVQAKRPLERDMESLQREMIHLTAAFARWLEADRRLDRQ